ncbi:hypothetical protein [Botrimarina hoheduenensis]|uniref:Uncharacterized protein n=1 Tax=Botrimarina hoheduenensis TaxID=2528000 RepID=A0A5C5W122_9BACT|nr:hypothetical protein [Botrimarina hoheduenensis]TWT43472.1 hypothetical protein Pla111_24230 [Botrimarina hoheduenensis]
MKTSLETIRNGLTAQLADLERDLQAAEARVNELKSTRRQVVAAIRALGGQGSESPKPAPKKAQVRMAVRDLLDSNGGAIDTDDLEGLVADKLANEQGCSAMGLALRMREVLATDEFIAASGQIRLSPTAKAGPEPEATKAT